MRRLPITKGLEFSCVGYGTGIEANRLEAFDYRKLEPVLEKAAASGVNWIDTAPVYGKGEAEKFLGGLKPALKEKFFIATKFGPEVQSPAELRKSLEESLKRLQVETIDLFQMHWAPKGIALEKIVNWLSELKREGKIRASGLCNVSGEDLERLDSQGLLKEVQAVQVEYNLFERTAEAKVLPLCETRGLALIGYTPLHRGKICNGQRQMKVLAEVAKAHSGASAARVALAWLTSRKQVLVVPNTTRVERMADLAAAGTLTLNSIEQERISRDCATPVQALSVDEIQPAPIGDAKAYHSLDEAIQNRLGLNPSPKELSGELKPEQILKPLRVKRLAGENGGKRYLLMEGRLRYWAWRIAFGSKVPIPCLIEED